MPYGVVRIYWETTTLDQVVRSAVRRRVVAFPAVRFARGDGAVNKAHNKSRVEARRDRRLDCRFIDCAASVFYACDLHTTDEITSAPSRIHSEMRYAHGSFNNQFEENKYAFDLRCACAAV
ncbi:unnamed protein product, partial [Iphiclides podalirius]